MWPGIFAAKATVPALPPAVYSVMKSEPPLTARFKAPKSPPPPPCCVLVCRVMELVIHESSPETAITLSQESRWISSTGMVEPMTSCCIAPVLIGRRRAVKTRAPGSPEVSVAATGANPA